MRFPRLAPLALLALAACGPSEPARRPADPEPPFVPVPQPPPPPSAAPAEAPPLGRLPTDVRPTRYALSMRIDPAQPRFAGVVDVAIELDRARSVVWLHGRDLHVTRAAAVIEGASPIEATWEQKSPGGVASLTLPTPIGPGRVRLHLEYDGAYGTNDEGLFTVERSGKRYAFTQLEAIYARRAFPCFDEPAFKVPFDVTLTIPRGLTAISNAREASRAQESDPAWERVTFAPTERIPTYLVALAVGDFDVVKAPDIPPSAVRKRPLPLRGVALKGRGGEMSYALAHTPALVESLEKYFGSGYPYEKLDLLAVPDKGGAMENPGAITFGDSILLFDEKTVGIEHKWSFETITGHELSHQWFGDLVTMPWWDDVWLNEAFAAWMERIVVTAVHPEYRPDIRSLESVHDAMSSDSLVSARKIRQEITADHDIENAFDGITYDKGNGVLSMFERWLGPETFQKGIRAHLAAHRFGTATADDLLNALGAAAGRDVATPFRTFLDQPGLPFVEARVTCDGKPRVELRQSRFLPVGSSGSGDARTWQIPICARFADGKQIKESCTLLTSREGVLPLDSAACPAWVMPNADAAGYYRWTLAPEDTRKLATVGYKSLRERERMSFGRSLTAGFARGKTPAKEVFESLAPLAADPTSAVAAEPMGFIQGVEPWLYGDPLHGKLRAYAAALYQPRYRALGWEPKKGAAEDPSRAVLRQGVISFLADVARDKEVLREAAARGRAYLGFGKDSAIHPEAVAPELTTTALAAAVVEGGAPVFDAVLAALDKEQRQHFRDRLVGALGAAREPVLAARALALVLDPRIRPQESLWLLGWQLRAPETRDAAWAWYEAHIDKVIARNHGPWESGVLYTGAGFCDRAHRDALEKLYAKRADDIEGGPRVLATVLESMSLCAARRDAQEASVKAFFAGKKKR